MSKRTLVSLMVGETKVFNFSENDLKNLVFVSKGIEITYSELTITGVHTFDQVKQMLSKNYPSKIQEVYLVEPEVQVVELKTEMSACQLLREQKKEPKYYSNLLRNLEVDYRAFLSEKYVAYMSYATHGEMAALMQIAEYQKKAGDTRVSRKAENTFMIKTIVQSIRSYMAGEACEQTKKWLV